MDDGDDGDDWEDADAAADGGSDGGGGGALGVAHAREVDQLQGRAACDEVLPVLRLLCHRIACQVKPLQPCALGQRLQVLVQTQARGVSIWRLEQQGKWEMGKEACDVS